MVLASRGEVVENSRVGTDDVHPREQRRTVRKPLGILLEEAAGAVAQTNSRKTVALRVRQKQLRVVARGAGGRGPSGDSAARGFS